MTTVALIRLGVMGAPMARNLLADGYGVAAYNRSRGRVEALTFLEARRLGTAAPAGAVVATLMAALRAEGHGGLDHAALVLLVEQLSGRTR